jgi:LacI family transcriptional regulator
VVEKRSISTIEQIARIADVSPSTVSRVLNGFGYVSEGTRSRVLYYIDKYDYHPNAAAQVLAGKKLKTLAVFLNFSFKDSDDDLFMVDDIALFQQVNATVSAAAYRGYSLITTVIDDVEDTRQQNIIRRTFFQGMVDAGLFIGFDDSCSIIDEIVASGFVVGVLDQNPKGHKEQNRIIFNYPNHDIGIMSVSYLYGLGHRKISVIGGAKSKYSGEARMSGIIGGMHNFNIEPLWVERVNFDALLSYKVMSEALSDNRDIPTALICGNDVLALGAIEAVKNAGKNVPHDISVIGVDDHIMAARFNPPLTTFRMDFIELLKDMTLKVIDAIDGLPGKHMEYKCSFSFVERRSCCFQQRK